jgi:hypothetical protein
MPVNQCSLRDTKSEYGSLRINELRAEVGHTSHTADTKKPGAAATATGFCGQGSEKTHNTTTHGNLSIPGVIEQLFSRRLISVARSVLYGLTGFKERGTTDKLASLYAMRLTREERLFMAWAALQSLDEKDAYIVATANLYGVYGGEVI